MFITLVNNCVWLYSKVKAMSSAYIVSRFFFIKFPVSLSLVRHLSSARLKNAELREPPYGTPDFTWISSLL